MLTDLLFPLSWAAKENTEFQEAQNLRFIFSFQGHYLLQLPTKSKASFFFCFFQSKGKSDELMYWWFHWAYVKLHQQRMCPYCSWQTSKKEPSLLPKCFHNWMTSMWALQEKGKLENESQESKCLPSDFAPYGGSNALQFNTRRDKVMDFRICSLWKS